MNSNFANLRHLQLRAEVLHDLVQRLEVLRIWRIRRRARGDKHQHIVALAVLAERFANAVELQDGINITRRSDVSGRSEHARFTSFVMFPIDRVVYVLVVHEYFPLLLVSERHGIDFPF